MKLGLLASAGKGLPSSACVLGAISPQHLALGDITTAKLRRRDNFDEGWRFTFGHLNEPARDFEYGTPSRLGTLSKANKLLPVTEWSFDDSLWQPIRLPHDWAVELPIVHDAALVMHGSRPVARTYPEISVAWYRKRFHLEAGELGRHVSIVFDGIFRNAQFFLNGYHLDLHESGYIPFELDITEYAVYGGENVVTVRVDASQQEGYRLLRAMPGDRHCSRQGW